MKVMKYTPVTVWTIKLLVEPELCSLEREIGCKDVPFLNMILIRLFFLLEAIIVGGHTSQGILSHSFSLDAAPVNFNYEANFSDRSYYAFESGV